MRSGCKSARKTHESLRTGLRTSSKSNSVVCLVCGAWASTNQLVVGKHSRFGQTAGRNRCTTSRQASAPCEGVHYTFQWWVEYADSERLQRTCPVVEATGRSDRLVKEEDRELLCRVQQILATEMLRVCAITDVYYDPWHWRSGSDRALARQNCWPERSYVDLDG